MRLLLLAFFLFSFNQVFAQATKFKRVTFGKTKNVKEEYHILKKDKKVKHGEYTSYYYNGQVKESGKYLNNQKDGKWLVYRKDGSLDELQHYTYGQKTGIWEERLERGSVIKQFDYDNDKKLELLINPPVLYPAIARDAEIEGFVELRYSFEGNCILKGVKVVKTLGYGCDEAAIEAMKRFVELTQKYAPEKCENISDFIPSIIRFTLH